MRFDRILNKSTTRWWNGGLFKKLFSIDSMWVAPHWKMSIHAQVTMNKLAGLIDTDWLAISYQLSQSIDEMHIYIKSNRYMVHRINCDSKHNAKSNRWHFFFFFFYKNVVKLHMYTTFIYSRHEAINLAEYCSIHIQFTVGCI